MSPRIVPPAEARRLADQATPGPWKLWGMSVLTDRSGTGVVNDAELIAGTSDPDRGLRTFNASLIAAAPDLAHTAAVLGEQVSAARSLHAGYHWCADAGVETGTGRYYGGTAGFCPTARALGMEAS